MRTDSQRPPFIAPERSTDRISFFPSRRGTIEAFTLKDHRRRLRDPKGAIWADMEDPSEAVEETILLRSSASIR